jgi:ABC-2 type transport system permease protein
VKEYLTLLRRELKSITKEKTIIFAIMIQFFIASFSSIILVGIMAFYDPSSISENSHTNITIGVVEDSRPGVMSAQLRAKGISVFSFYDQNSAEQAFLARQVDAVMVIPPASAGVVNMKLVLPQLDTKQTVILMALQEPLKDYEKFLRLQNGVELNYPAIPDGKSSNTYEFLYSIVIPILMLFPALIAGSIMIDSVSEEFENKTFDTLMASPVSLNQIFSAKITAAIITATIQLIMWTLLLRINGLTVQNPLFVIVVAIFMAMIISIIAAIIALYSKDRERSQFVYSIVLIFLVGTSNFLGFSPVNVITLLAAGVHNIELFSLFFYLGLIVVLGTISLQVSKKLVLLQH